MVEVAKFQYYFCTVWLVTGPVVSLRSGVVENLSSRSLDESRVQLWHCGRTRTHPSHNAHKQAWTAHQLDHEYRHVIGSGLAETP